MAWIPSCELPAIRMTASEIFETFGAPPALGATTDESLMKTFYSICALLDTRGRLDRSALQTVQYQATKCVCSVNFF